MDNSDNELLPPRARRSEAAPRRTGQERPSIPARFKHQPSIAAVLAESRRIINESRCLRARARALTNTTAFDPEVVWWKDED